MPKKGVGYGYAALPKSMAMTRAWQFMSKNMAQHYWEKVQKFGFQGPLLTSEASSFLRQTMWEPSINIDVGCRLLAVSGLKVCWYKT